MNFLIYISILLIVAANIQLRHIKMTIDEVTQKVNSIGDQLAKALAEIEQELQNLGQVPQALSDALDRAQAAAQALDDLNPDQPPPPPAPQP